MTATPEQFMQKARGIYDAFFASDSVYDTALVDAIARALQEQYSEGMRRAAEMVRDQAPATQDMTSTMVADALDAASDTILSELPHLQASSPADKTGDVTAPPASSVTHSNPRPPSKSTPLPDVATGESVAHAADASLSSSEQEG